MHRLTTERLVYLDDRFAPVRRTCPEYGKTNAQLACAIEVYITPWHKRALWALMHWGWLLALCGAALAAYLHTPF